MHTRTQAEEFSKHVIWVWTCSKNVMEGRFFEWEYAKKTWAETWTPMEGRLFEWEYAQKTSLEERLFECDGDQTTLRQPSLARVLISRDAWASHRDTKKKKKINKKTSTRQAVLQPAPGLLQSSKRLDSDLQTRWRTKVSEIPLPWWSKQGAILVLWSLQSSEHC